MAARPLSIRVRTLDGNETTLPQHQDIYHKPVAELVKAACDKIGLSNHEEFSFTLNKQPSECLNPKKSLLEQGIQETATLTVTLRKRLFLTETTHGCRINDQELKLIYLQLQDSIINGTCPCSCDEAIELAALQCHIEYGNYDKDVHKPDFLELKCLLPKEYVKVKGIKLKILKAYRSLELSESDDAKSEYIRFCTTLERYGITSYSGKEDGYKKILFKSLPTLTECCIGITHDSIWRVKAKSNKVEKWPFVNIHSWYKSPKNNTVLTLRFDVNGNEKYSFQPSKAQCDTIIQLINDYVTIKQKRCSVEMPMEVQSTLSIGEDQPIGPGIGHSPINSRQDSAASSIGASATINSSEGVPPSIGETDTLSIARGNSAAMVVNNMARGEDSLVFEGDGPQHVSHEGETRIKSESDAPINNSEEDSPIRDVQDRLTIAKLKIIQNKTWKARFRWQNIGIQLDLEKNDLDAINLANNSDTDTCFIEMLSLWLKQTSSLPTWSKMIRALKRPAVGFQSLAEEIEMKLNLVDKPSIEPFQFPHLDVIALDEHSREELEGRLRVQTRDIMDKFYHLQNQFFDTLQDQYLKKQTEDQERFVKRLARYLKHYRTEEFNLTSIDDVQDFIEKKSSFYDYEILKYIIGLAGAERDKLNIQEYENRFWVYARRRVYECPSKISASPMNPDSQTESSKLYIKLDSKYNISDSDLECTLDKVKQFQHRLCNVLNMPVCKLMSIERGCLRLTFAVHSNATFQLSTKQRTDLMELGVLQLEYRDYVYRFSQLKIKHKLLRRIRVLISRKDQPSAKEPNPISCKTWPQPINSVLCINYGVGTFVYRKESTAYKQ